MSSRRVVITGIGMITSLGLDVNSTWQNILACKSGIKKITRFDTTNISSKVAGIIDHEGLDAFIPEQYIDPKDLRKMDTFIQLGYKAAIEAVTDSGWMPEDEESRMRTGVMLGSGVGGIDCIDKNSKILNSGGRVSPYFIVSSLINLLSGNVSIKYGFRGPNHAVVTACATGAHAIGDAARIIKYGDADVMVAGGAEAAVTNLCMSGFAAAKTLSSGFNDTPEKASRPWDKTRDGFVIGEGAGVVVLEEYEHAQKRNAKIYAEVLGYGMGGDAYHITSPHPDGLGALYAMQAALRDAKITAADIGYINAHATSTPVGDGIELAAVQKTFVETNSKVLMSSTKSMIGHLLGAAGAVETIFTTLALRDQIAPATLNLDDPMDGVVLDLVAHKPKECKMSYAMTNSFGFGGTNASLILKKL
jgi:3-oxoacyl-[acyl-carrier-protein] synthase II